MFSWTMGLATLFTLHIQSLRKNFNVMNKRSQEFFSIISEHIFMYSILQYNDANERTLGGGE